MTSMRENSCFFVSDLHGKPRRYDTLWGSMLRERPSAVFVGGDLFPHSGWDAGRYGTFGEYLREGFRAVKQRLQSVYPRVFMILGNDDKKTREAVMHEGEGEGLWEYIHNRETRFDDCPVFGYAYVPPTPFRLKDWERYDVSRYIDPGCIPPEAGTHTVAVEEREVLFLTIEEDLAAFFGDRDLREAIILFHTPPYKCNLDRAALDGKSIDHAPMDVHVGSIAVRRLIEKRQPSLSLHGHIHESPRLTGSWRDLIGQTHCFSAAHDGPELALVRFDLAQLDAATRELL